METTQTPNSSGNESLEERLKGWEREKRGLIKDVQAERDERQALEKRLAEMESALNSAAEQPEANANEKVQKLAQDPDAYIQAHLTRALDQRVVPLEQSLQSIAKERRFEKAYSWIAKQEKKDVEEIPGSEIESEIARITKENNMGMMDPVEGVKAAYKIFLQEKREKEISEVRREEAIQGNSTATVRSPSSVGQHRFTKAEIEGMSSETYMKNREAILEAQRNGWITN